MLADLRHRLRALLRRHTVERELGDELQFHLDQAIDQHRRAGLSPAEAARRAKHELGGIDQLKDACREERGVAPLDRLMQDIGYAGRLIRRRPAFAAAVVGTLGLGIGATTTVFGVVDGILIRPLPYADAARLVQMGTTFGSIEVSAMSPPDFLDIVARTKTLTAMGAVRTRSMDVTGRGAPERVKAAAVSASFFETLAVPPAIGRVFGRDSDPAGGEPLAILAHGLWLRRFGGEAGVVGGSISLNGLRHTIVAVMPAGFRGPDALSQQDTEVWVPLGTLPAMRDDRDDASWGVVGRLAPGIDVDVARADLASVAQELGREHSAQSGRKFWLMPLADRTVGDAGSQLWLIFGAVSGLLLIACANIAGLFLVRATERSREMAVRAALGAGRGRIVRQLLTESAVLALLGGALGLALASAGLGAFRALGPPDLPRLADVGIDVRVLLFSIALSALSGFAFGLVPAIDAARAAVGVGLRASARGVTAGRAHTRLRSFLVVVQTAVALTLLVGAGLLANSLVRLGRVDPGFDATHAVWIDLTLPARYADGSARLVLFEDVLTSTRSLPGVITAAGIAGRPLGGGNAVSTVFPEGRLPDRGERTPRVPYHAVTPGYFATLGIPLVDGRDVTVDDRGPSPRVAIVSRAFAEQFWPGERAVGKRFWMGRVAADAPLTTVIGVAENVRQYELARPADAIVYRPFAQVPGTTLSVIARLDGRDESQMLASLRETVWRHDPALPVDTFGTMAATVRASIGEPRFRALALSIFGAVALLLVAVGLHGTLASVVRARRHELGIRLLLGAEAGTVRNLVLVRGLRLALAGTVLGLAGSLAAAQLLESFMFHISPTDAPTFAIAAGLMLAIAMLASWLPARRAARTNPIETLRVG